MRDKVDTGTLSKAIIDCPGKGCLQKQNKYNMKRKEIGGSRNSSAIYSRYFDSSTNLSCSWATCYTNSYGRRYLCHFNYSRSDFHKLKLFNAAQSGRGPFKFCLLWSVLSNRTGLSTQYHSTAVLPGRFWKTGKKNGSPNSLLSSLQVFQTTHQINPGHNNGISWCIIYTNRALEARCLL